MATDGRSLELTGGDYPEDVEAMFFTPNSFDFLGVPPALGRSIVPSDAPDAQAPQPVVVLSYKFWQRRFGANPGVLGQSIQLNRKSYRIIGVAAPRFTWNRKDVYLPLQLTQDPSPAYSVYLRLKPGATKQAASAALQPLLDEFARQNPKQFPEHFQVALEGLNDWVVKGMGSTLDLLFGGVALLLLIGCGNVSILLLARGTAREHELAVRSALGAGRARIIRQLLTESVLLAFAGAALGVLIAYAAVRVIKVILPQFAIASEVSVGINLPVLFFSVAVALATGILFGLAPALRLSRPIPGKALQSRARRIAGSVRGRRMHHLLIASQIALTLLLLAGAGAAINGFLRLINLPPGYDPHNVISVWIPLHVNSYTRWSERSAYIEQLRDAVNHVPGVAMTAIATNATPPQAGWRMPFELLGAHPLGAQTALVNVVGPEFFRVLRIPLMQGRTWSESENHNGAHLAVINQTMARMYFPDGDAVGHSIKLPALADDPPSTLAATGIAGSWLQIIGVVADSRNDGLRNPVSPAIFIPYTLCMPQGTVFLVRTNVPPLTLLHAIRQAVASVNADQITARVITDLDHWISDQPEWQQGRLVAWLLATFAVLALCLAAVGLYSTVSYAVAERTSEFGIRMALGAERGHILRVVFASTVASVGSGIAAGVILALALQSLLASWVGGNLRNPILLLCGAILLTLVSALACYLPARRAAHLDPMTALRCE
jgi:predicted permease